LDPHVSSLCYEHPEEGLYLDDGLDLPFLALVLQLTVVNYMLDDILIGQAHNKILEGEITVLPAEFHYLLTIDLHKVYEVVLANLLDL